jgi:hypothetical protein
MGVVELRNSAAVSCPPVNADGPPRSERRITAAGAARPVRTKDADLQLAVDGLAAAELVVKAAAQEVLRAVAELGAARFGASALTVYRDKAGRCYIDMVNDGRGRRLALLDRELYTLTEHAACLGIDLGQTRTVEP